MGRLAWSIPLAAMCVGALTLSPQGLLPGAQGGAAPASLSGAVPLELAALYARLNGTLAQFETRLRRDWNGSRHPVIFSAGLVTANPNAGDALLHPSTYEMSVKYIDRLHSLGVKGVAIDINFPLLAPGFQEEARRRQLLDFYRRLAAEIRRRGMTLSIESTTIFPDYSSLQVSRYYRTLSFDDYVKGRAEVVGVIAGELKPDHLTVANEPDTEAHNSGQPVTDLTNSLRLINALASEARRTGTGGLQVGAGFGSWQKNYSDWATAYSRRASLDFLNIHIYPVDGDLLERVLRIADIGRQNGRRVAVHEAWLYKWQAGETSGVASSQEVYARDVYSFWQPVDQKFLEVLAGMAHHKQFLYVSLFWSNYFFAYLDYAAAATLPASVRLKRALTEGVDAALVGRVSRTGVFYKSLISQ